MSVISISKSLTFLSFPGKVFELCHPFQPAKFGFTNTRSGMNSSWNGKVYIYIQYLHLLLYVNIRIYILQDHPIKPWKSMKIRISLFRHVSLVHLFSCFFGYNNVTYKNKQESSSQNYLGMGPTQSFRRKTRHDESFTTGESPLLIWFHIAWN